MQTFAHYGLVAARVAVTLLAALLIVVAFLLREEEEIKLQSGLARLSERIRQRVGGIFETYRAELVWFKQRMPKMWEDRTRPSTEMPFSGWFLYCGLLVFFSFGSFVVGFGLLALPYTRHFMVRLLTNADLSNFALLSMIFASGLLSVLAMYGPGQFALLLKSKPNLQITVYFMLRVIIACTYIMSWVGHVPHSVLWARIRLCFLLTVPAAVSPIAQSLILIGVLGHVILSVVFERPIHAIHRHNILQKRIFLLSIAILMLTWSIPQLQAVWRLLGNLK